MINDKRIYYTQSLHKTTDYQETLWTNRLCLSQPTLWCSASSGTTEQHGYNNKCSFQHLPRNLIVLGLTRSANSGEFMIVILNGWHRDKMTKQPYLFADVDKRLLKLVGRTQTAIIELDDGFVQQYLGIVGPRLFDPFQML